MTRFGSARNDEALFSLIDGIELRPAMQGRNASFS
jgi:hypothetical protein